MPANQALKYYDITDFTAGVFTDPGGTTQLLMPATGAQQLDDAYPQPQGGLRAFFNSDAITTSGVVSTTQEICTGIFVVSGYARRTGGVGETGIVWYMTTWNNTTNRARIYRMDGTTGETTWHVMFTGATTADNEASRQYSSFKRFITTAGADYVIIALRSGLESERGLYALRYTPGDPTPGTDGDISQISTHYGPLAIAQARIIVAGSTSGTDDFLYWGTVGAITFTGNTSGSVRPQPNQSGNTIEYIGASDPDQLLIGFSGAPWVTITGDINSPTTPIRAMGYGHACGSGIQDDIRTPQGNVFMESHGTAYRTDGRSFDPLTPHLTAFSGQQASGTVKTAGTGCFAEGFLCLPDSRFMHEESKGWFHVSDQESCFSTFDFGLGLFSASAGTSFTLKLRDVTRALGDRCSAYTWRSAPFAQTDGTQSQLREVQILAECYSSSTYTVTITNEFGETQSFTTSATGTGRHVTVEPCLLTGHYLDIKVVATAAGSGEAPTIEKIRLGFATAKRL